jgi:hypothetical protein
MAAAAAAAAATMGVTDLSDVTELSDVEELVWHAMLTTAAGLGDGVRDEGSIFLETGGLGVLLYFIRMRRHLGWTDERPLAPLIGSIYHAYQSGARRYHRPIESGAAAAAAAVSSLEDACAPFFCTWLSDGADRTAPITATAVPDWYTTLGKRRGNPVPFFATRRSLFCIFFLHYVFALHSGMATAEAARIRYTHFKLHSKLCKAYHWAHWFDPVADHIFRTGLVPPLSTMGEPFEII